MKTILYSGITANGNYGSSDTGQMPKQEELDNLFNLANQVGNIIVGRKTYEIFNVDNIFSGYDTVVVSQQKIFEGIEIQKSPLDALNYLKRKKYEKVLVIGGVSLANSFLKEDLVNELYINIEPYIEEGLRLDPLDGKFRSLQLLGYKELGSSGIVQLHYKID